MSSLKIAIAGGFDTGNLGDYASFSGLTNVLKSHSLSPDFVHFSRHPRDSFGREFPFVKQIQNLDWGSSVEAKGRMFLGFNRGDPGDRLSILAQEIEASDVLLLGNGRLLVDYSLGPARGPLAYFSLLSSLATVSNTPYVLWSMTLVELRTKRGRDLLAQIIRGAKFLFLRDSGSAQIAVKYGASPSRIRVVPDFAWAMSREPLQPDSRHSHQFAQNDLEMRVGINFRAVSAEAQMAISQQAKVLGKIVDLVDFTAVAQQHYSDSGGADANDDETNRGVMTSLGLEASGVRNQLLSLADLCQVYDQLDVLVTTRRHGMIIAATRGLPSVLWALEENTLRAMENYPVEGIVGPRPAPIELHELRSAVEKRADVLEYADSEKRKLESSVVAEELLGIE